VAYVFVHLLPDLAGERETLREATGERFSFLEYHVYLVALVGLAAFYGLERAAKLSRGRGRARGQDSRPGPASSGCPWAPSPSTTRSSAT
jgi:hypothetical protein